jgi:hypothetical protein
VIRFGKSLKQLSLCLQVVEKIANFTQFISTQQNSLTDYIDWQDKDWSEFSLEQFFCEEDEVEYSLEDAQEIYQS